MQGRGQRQWIVIQVYAAGAVALLGFAGADLDTRWAALFGVPIISILAWLWHRDQEVNLGKLTSYEREVIRPAVAHIVGDDGVLSWHEFAQHMGTAHHAVAYLSALLVLLLGPPAAAVALSLKQDPDEVWRYIVWAALAVPLMWGLSWSLKQFLHLSCALLQQRWSRRRPQQRT